MRLAALTLVLLGALGGAAPIPSGRVFYASFDGTLEGGQAEGKVEFVPGRVGQAAVVGNNGGSAAAVFPSAGHISLERGTLCLWVMPVDWLGDDTQSHLLFQVHTAGGGQYLLYKYSTPSWGATFHLDPAEGVGAKMNIFKPVRDWRPGQWHHLAIAWTRYEAMKLYVDGQLAAISRGAGLTDKPLEGPLRFGGSWGSNTGRTALDEAMIFGRMLSDEEIARLADVPLEGPDTIRPAVGDVSRDIPGVMLTHAVLSQQVLARVYDDALGAPCREARLTLVAPDGKEAAVQDLALKPGLNQAQLDLTPLPLGVYEARLTLLPVGQRPVTESLRVSKETSGTWADAAKLGKRDTVLPPFEPLKTADNRLAMYARSIELGGDGLPAKTMSRGTDLLAGPVRIVAETAAGRLTLAPGKLQTHSASPTKTLLSGSARARDLTISTNVEARYDGTMWFSLNVQPQEPLNVRRLQIEIPCRADAARLYAYDAYGRIDDKRFGYGAVSEGQGTVWQREFMPAIWLGTEDFGLGWYAESDEGWDTDGEEALSLVRDGPTVRLCLNVIRRPRHLDRPLRLEFGLCPTPVRPLQPDWRAYQQLPSSEITRYFLHLKTNPYPRADLAGQTPSGQVAYLYNYHDYFTNTLPKDPDEFREMIRRVKEYGLLGTPYTDTTYLPEWQGDLMLRPEMRVHPGNRATTYGPVCNIDVCHRGQYGDWYVWYIHHLISTYGINGIYFDDMAPYGCNNAAHGCGYVAVDGSRRKTYAMRARMETYRRVRELFADTGQPFWITYHISGTRVAPLAIYGDGLLMAEERNPIVGKNPDYLANTTSAEWRASFSPEAWGIPVYAIPQFKMNADWMKDPELAERLVAAVTPHDLLIWPLFIHEPTVLAAREIMDDFGVGQPDTKCLPFWHADTGIAADTDRAWITGYLRPGKLLLCATNPTDQPLAVNVTLDTAKLALAAAAQATDRRTGVGVPWQAGKLSLTLPPKRVQFFEIR